MSEAASPDCVDDDGLELSNLLEVLDISASKKDFGPFLTWALKHPRVQEEGDTRLLEILQAGSTEQRECYHEVCLHIYELESLTVSFQGFLEV